MNWADLRKRLTPHIISVAVFIAITFLFLNPVFRGKALPQNDIRQWQGSYQETKQYLEKTGERTLWTNSMFGGMPTYQVSPYSDYSLFGSRWLYNLFISWSPLPVPANAVFLYCFSFYLLLLAFSVTPWLALAGGIAFGLSSFNIVIIEAGHMLQAYAVGFAPLILAAGVFTLRRRKFLLGGALFSLALAFQLLANHPQISYYTAIIFGIYMVGEFVYHLREKRILDFAKAAAVFLTGGILAVGSTATFIITTAEYSNETIRGKSDLTKTEAGTSGSGLDRDYAFTWSYGKGETFSVIIPDFRGGSSGAIGNDNPGSAEEADPGVRQYVSQMDQYWGAQYMGSSGPFYFGAVICFLFILALFFYKGHDKWWILAVFIFSAMLSWGREFPAFNYWMFDHFPLYNKFRSVQFTLIMASIVVPILGIVVLDRIIRNPLWDAQIRKRFLIVSGAAAGFCLLIYLMPSLAGDFRKPDEPRQTADGKQIMVEPDRYELQQSVDEAQRNDPQVMQQIETILDGVYTARADILTDDAIRSFFFILLAAGLLYLFFTGKLKREFLIAGIGVLILADLFSVDRRYLNEDSFVNKNSAQTSFFPSQADLYILQDKDPNYRVVNVGVNTFNDATTSYFHKSVGGYHGAKLRRIQDLIENHLGNAVGMIRQNMGKIPGTSLLDYMQQSGQLSTLNMLNTKYIMTGKSQTDVIPNPYALGNAWFVKGVKTVSSADAEIKAMERFNPADTAIVDIAIKEGRFGKHMEGFTPSGDTTGTIRLTSYKPNELTYESNSPAERFAVFSEMYYDDKLGWNVYVDGKKADHIRVNFILRGMRVPAGKHTIVFKFEPASYARGEQISLIMSLAMILGLAGAVYYEWRRSKKGQTPAAA